VSRTNFYGCGGRIQQFGTHRACTGDAALASSGPKGGPNGRAPEGLLQQIVKNPHSTTAGRGELDLQAIAHEAFEAHSSIFYWITGDQKMDGIITCGICSNDMPWYLREMQSFDPLNIARLSGSNKRVATLSIDSNLAPVDEFHYYEKYMQSCGIHDVLDFLFWDGPKAIAGLGVIKTKNDSPITHETIRVARSIQPLLESKLHHHPKIVAGRVQRRLREQYNLTEREMDVANLIRGGLTNRQISEELNIAEGTVKTHLWKLFQKLQVSNRTMIPVRLAAL
jgi:DNA-binding CsgD family transcriptional regulator